MVLVISSCSKQEFENNLATDVDKLSQASSRDKDGSVYEVEYILEYIKANKPIDWTKERDAKLLHSIGYYTDYSYIVGYKPKGFTDFENGLNLSELSNPTWKTAKENILSEFDFTKNDILQEPGDDLFPGVLVESRSIETMERLMKMDELNYVEPQIDIFLLMFDEELQAQLDLGFEGPLPSGDQYVSLLNRIGCSCEEPMAPNPLDYKLIGPNMKMPWNYEFNGISEVGLNEDPDQTNAWSKSTGDGIGVAVIDSGVSFEQENLDNFGEFDMVGQSFGRYEERRDFLGYETKFEIIPSNPGPTAIRLLETRIEDVTRAAHDRCGHGTRQAGLVAGPRGADGNSVGVAYNCDLYNYRALHNPLILTLREKMAVGRALRAAAAENNIKIISMAIAQPNVFDPSISIELAINVAYNEGKMMVCAAGTGFTELNPNLVVLYPARSSKTVAVTGMREPESFPAPLGILEGELCDKCFGGGQVDFAVIMQDNSDENNARTTMTITCTGDEPEYSTGSSSATGTFSGMAALVWSKLGSSATREQVLDRMRAASSRPDGAHLFLGHGYVNVNIAME